jgi:hypothetical protein
MTWDANGTGAGQTNGAGAWLGTNLWDAKSHRCLCCRCFPAIWRWHRPRVKCCSTFPHFRYGIRLVCHRWQWSPDRRPQWERIRRVEIRRRLLGNRNPGRQCHHHWKQGEIHFPNAINRQALRPAQGHRASSRGSSYPDPTTPSPRTSVFSHSAAILSLHCRDSWAGFLFTHCLESALASSLA